MNGMNLRAADGVPVKFQQGLFILKFGKAQGFVPGGKSGRDLERFESPVSGHGKKGWAEAGVGGVEEVVLMFDRERCFRRVPARRRRGPGFSAEYFTERLVRRAVIAFDFLGRHVIEPIVP